MFVTEKHTRTLAKTITYRILCTIAIFLIALALSADGAASGTLAIAIAVLGTIIYYIHDRVWTLIKWRRDTADGNESNLRSIVKTIVYRLITVVIGIILAKLILTDSTGMAVAFAIGQFLANMILYYIVERVFNKIQQGKVILDEEF